MQEHGTHHIPVVDEHESHVGLISATDSFVPVQETGWEESAGAG